MITAVFYQNPSFDITGFCISGHADFADCGSDIVCAAVSAMSALTINTLEEIFSCHGTVKAEKSGQLSYRLPSKSGDKTAYGILSGFKLQLESYSEMYPKNIKVSLCSSK